MSEKSKPKKPLLMSVESRLALMTESLANAMMQQDVPSPPPHLQHLTRRQMLLRQKGLPYENEE